MSDLQKIAEQAQKDAHRAKALRTAIQIVGDNADGVLMRPSIDFVGNHNHEGGEEVSRALKRMWPATWEETMRASAEELKQIEAKYAPLMSEVRKDD